MNDRAYDDEQVKEILRRAVETEAARSTTLTHEELVAAAGEIGIGREAVEKAAVELWLGQSRQAEDDDLAIYKHGRRLSLLRWTLVFLAAIASALGAQALLGLGNWIFLPLILWAFMLSARGISIFLQDPEKAKRASRRAAAKRRRRQRARKPPRQTPKRAPRPRPQANPQVSELVQEGVSLLLRVMEQSHQQRQRAQGEFGRYVDARGGARARVATDEPAEEVEVEDATRARRAKR